MRIPVLLTLIVTLVACKPVREAPTPSPKPVPDTELIPAMCQHLGPKNEGGLGCEEGEPVYNSNLPGPKGVPNQSCTDFYMELQAKGNFVNPRCVSKITACDQIESARQNVCP